MGKKSNSSTNEKIILQEDCSEDILKTGILTLTNKKLIFEKTKGRMATLSKKLLDEKVEIEFSDIENFKSEGFIIKKLVIIDNKNKIYKFGVLNPKRWSKGISAQIGHMPKSHDDNYKLSP